MFSALYRRVALIVENGVMVSQQSDQSNGHSFLFLLPLPYLESDDGGIAGRMVWCWCDGISAE